MFFVAFEQVQPTSHATVSEAYYTQLQKLLSSQPGFISEIFYAHPSDPEKGVLIARFVDEAAEKGWRLQHTHLKIQHTARESIFADYRLRVGPEVDLLEESEGMVEREGTEGQRGTVTLLYERPISEGGVKPEHDIRKLVDGDDAGALGGSSGFVDSTFYQNEKALLWVSGWISSAVVAGFMKSLGRVQGDSVHLFQVTRDYTKFKRGEAPRDADEAQEGSVTQ